MSGADLGLSIDLAFGLVLSIELVPDCEFVPRSTRDPFVVTFVVTLQGSEDLDRDARASPRNFARVDAGGCENSRP